MRPKQIRLVVMGAMLVVVTRAPLGLRPPALWAGLRYGLGASAAGALGVAATTRLPPVQAAMTQRQLPEPTSRWLLLDIPLATVWAEEVIYRAALGSAAAKAFGPAAGRLVQSAVFGLSHVADARSTGEPVVPTVLVTAAAGWGFAWLYGRSGSLAAPMLTHLAINEAGAVAALSVQRIVSTDGQR